MKMIHTARFLVSTAALLITGLALAGLQELLIRFFPKGEQYAAAQG